MTKPGVAVMEMETENLLHKKTFVQCDIIDCVSGSDLDSNESKSLASNCTAR